MGMPILRLAPCWSVFDRRKVTVKPSWPKAQSSAYRPTSSDRRNAPANPSRIRARSLRLPAPWLLQRWPGQGISNADPLPLTPIPG
jgi:hypothetical protein